MQIRAISVIEYDYKTAYDFSKFLKSKYTTNNEQVVQNLCFQLDKLLYVKGMDCYEHLKKFNSLITQLAVQNVPIDDKQKKYMLICSLPESMSLISTVAHAQTVLYNFNYTTACS